MDGYETAALIRERPASHDTPIIFLTAYHKADIEMHRGYSLGAVDYLFKPPDVEILRTKVAVFVELRKKSVLIRKQSEKILQRETEARQHAEARVHLLAELERNLAAVSEAESLFRGLFDHVAAGVATADLDGRIIKANGALQAMLGYSQEGTPRDSAGPADVSGRRQSPCP